MPQTTIIRDSHGCIHIWKGYGTPKYHPTLPTVNGTEADLFVQSCSAIDGIREYLTSHEISELENGYAIHCNTIPSEYFD